MVVAVEEEEEEGEEEAAMVVVVVVVEVEVEVDGRSSRACLVECVARSCTVGRNEEGEGHEKAEANYMYPMRRQQE